MAYIDEVEQPSKDRPSSRTNPKLYYSTLAKAALPTKSIDSQDPVQYLDQVKLTKIESSDDATLDILIMLSSVVKFSLACSLQTNTGIGCFIQLA